MKEIRAHFNPMQCLSPQINSLLKNRLAKEQQDHVNYQLNFDAIWTFEIMGKKFEQHLNPLEIGVFNSAKCYFIVCIKGTKLAIFLWRGRNQTLINYQSAIELFVDTTFRNVANDSLPKTTHVNRATS